MPDTTDILTPEQVREACLMFPDCWTLQVIGLSHEILRAEADRQLWLKGKMDRAANELKLDADSLVAAVRAKVTECTAATEAELDEESCDSDDPQARILWIIERGCDALGSFLNGHRRIEETDKDAALARLAEVEAAAKRMFAAMEEAASEAGKNWLDQQGKLAEVLGEVETILSSPPKPPRTEAGESRLHWRAVVFAEPVQGSDGGWLVTLECGHKLAVRKKLIDYACSECREATEARPVEVQAKAGESRLPKWHYVCRVCKKHIGQDESQEPVLIICDDCIRKQYEKGPPIKDRPAEVEAKAGAPMPLGGPLADEGELSDYFSQCQQNIRCGVCKAVWSGDGSWRWSGKGWEHQCPGNIPQAGHFEAELIPPTPASTSASGEKPAILNWLDFIVAQYVACSDDFVLFRDKKAFGEAQWDIRVGHLRQLAALLADPPPATSATPRQPLAGFAKGAIEERSDFGEPLEFTEQPEKPDAVKWLRARLWKLREAIRESIEAPGIEWLEWQLLLGRAITDDDASAAASGDADSTPAATGWVRVSSFDPWPAIGQICLVRLGSGKFAVAEHMGQWWRSCPGDWTLSPTHWHSLPPWHSPAAGQASFCHADGDGLCTWGECPKRQRCPLPRTAGQAEKGGGQ